MSQKYFISKSGSQKRVPCNSYQHAQRKLEALQEKYPKNQYKIVVTVKE